MIANTDAHGPAIRSLQHLAYQSRAPRLRSMREFAEHEIVLPSGPFAGSRFKCARQPYTRLWFDAVDSGAWTRYVATGPTQSGKTLAAFVIPTLYHLFEYGETVICGVPSLDMIADKWRDLLQVIEASRYRELLPAAGSGSRGGSVAAIHFRNGALLRFMTGGGSDKTRAAFTSRVVVITETDGMDEPGRMSREADKITQLEARSRAYGSRRRTYMECTVSIEEGRTWREYTGATHSRIAVPCPHCRQYVTLERDDLQGWQGAESVVQARAKAHWRCPVCRASWTEQDRAQAVAQSVLLHGEQTVDEVGLVVGGLPETDTLGFRWSAPDNLFVTAADVGADEWRAANADDEEVAEKELRQFVWALPHVPAAIQIADVDVREITRRVGEEAKGTLPPGTERLTVGIDLGAYVCHWTAIAWQSGATGRVIDYGQLDVPTRQHGAEKALLIALGQFRDDVLERGWRGCDGGLVTPDRVWIDAAWCPDPIYQFCYESGEHYQPTKGHGSTQVMVRSYTRPKATGAIVAEIGEGYHISRLRAAGGGGPRVRLVEIDSDHWKLWLQQRLLTPADRPGALTLYRAQPQEHLTFARHLAAERKVEEFVPGRGAVTRWQQVYRQNHWLDATMLACGAGYHAGVRLIGPHERPPGRERVVETGYFARQRERAAKRGRPRW